MSPRREDAARPCHSTASRCLGDHVLGDGLQRVQQLCLHPGFQDEQVHVDLREKEESFQAAVVCCGQCCCQAPTQATASFGAGQNATNSAGTGGCPLQSCRLCLPPGAACWRAPAQLVPARGASTGIVPATHSSYSCEGQLD